ncbi:MAG: hypothetical protein EA397_12760 [Deltaproteobacteria bacterium]|nr:MAG: hypothetical protein EA397_12760 [Deltaproteobacteria bacterium]
MTRRLIFSLFLASTSACSEPELTDSFFEPEIGGDRPYPAWRGPVAPSRVGFEVTEVGSCMPLNSRCGRRVARTQYFQGEELQWRLLDPGGREVEAQIEPKRSIALPDGWFQPGTWTVQAFEQGALLHEESFVVMSDGVADHPHPWETRRQDLLFELQDLADPRPMNLFPGLGLRLHEGDEGSLLSVYANINNAERRCRAYQGPIVHEPGGLSHASAEGISVGTDPTFDFDQLDLLLAVTEEPALAGIDLVAYGPVEPYAKLLGGHFESDDLDDMSSLWCGTFSWGPENGCEPCAYDLSSTCLNLEVFHGLATPIEIDADLDDVPLCSPPRHGEFACSVVGPGLVGGWTVGVLLLLFRRRRSAR